MKRLILILTLFLLIINPCFAVTSVVKKDLTVISDDGFSIKAVFEYPKDKSKKEFSTVVLLHSLGYSSEWWETLPQELIDCGYAVLKIDLRGHGKSVLNKKLVKISWKDMTNNAYAKYPDDVIKVIEQVKSDNNKTVFFDKWAIVGSDIGASTAIIASDKILYKPKTIVMLSPGINIKGLYIPVKFAQLSDIDVFSISGTNDLAGKESEDYLQRFAQAEFVKYTSKANTNGILMLKSDPPLVKIITSWLKEYL